MVQECGDVRGERRGRRRGGGGGGGTIPGGVCVVVVGVVLLNWFVRGGREGEGVEVNVELKYKALS